ncbi:MAG: protein kinase [Acidobacteriia bacterium]|nr:protein kinase [Terriglobia bacterium]
MPTLTKAGRYELREELGRGAMGVVYRAHDPVIGRDVAVKTMHLSEAGTGMSREELVSRFQTEARAAGLLSHPNIVVAHDAGEEEGNFYITMELVEGRSLQTLLDARQLFPLPRVMRLMEQVCSALDFAHQRNVVHRDIKPANLMLTADDTVKITDFGTAKILQFGTAQTAHVMGTPSYMSPEQVKGKPVDGRSDIFSVGVILYELMTGEKPFPGENITTVIYKIINEEPIPPRSLDSSIHPGLSEVITRALAKDPSLRFQNCHELLGALKSYHDLVGPDTTVKMSPVNTQAMAGGTRAATQPARSLNVASNARTNAMEAPVRPVPWVTEEEQETAKKRGSLVLTVILLGIIGFASYRIWPPMLDIWQRMHQPAGSSITPAVASPMAPAANNGTPDTKPDTFSQAAPPAPKTAPTAPEENLAPQQTLAPKVPSKTPEPSAVPPTGSVEKATPPQEPASFSATPAANSLKSTLGSELAGLSLSDKVKMQVTGNTLTISGQLTPREHSELLNHLHKVPAGVRIIDDIGYANGREEIPRVAEAGWVWIHSAPQGAEILVDGTDTGLRTPARVEMPQGEHEVLLTLHGFANAHRTLLIRPGQTMQFTELLGQQ